MPKRAPAPAQKVAAAVAEQKVLVNAGMPSSEPVHQRRIEVVICPFQFRDPDEASPRTLRIVLADGNALDRAIDEFIDGPWIHSANEDDFQTLLQIIREFPLDRACRIGRIQLERITCARTMSTASLKELVGFRKAKRPSRVVARLLRYGISTWMTMANECERVLDCEYLTKSLSRDRKELSESMQQRMRTFMLYESSPKAPLGPYRRYERLLLDQLRAGNVFSTGREGKSKLRELMRVVARSYEKDARNRYGVILQEMNRVCDKIEPEFRRLGFGAASVIGNHSERLDCLQRLLALAENEHAEARSSGQDQSEEANDRELDLRECVASGHPVAVMACYGFIARRTSASASAFLNWVRIEGCRRMVWTEGVILRDWYRTFRRNPLLSRADRRINQLLWLPKPSVFGCGGLGDPAWLSQRPGYFNPIVWSFLHVGQKTILAICYWILGLTGAAAEDKATLDLIWRGFCTFYRSYYLPAKRSIERARKRRQRTRLPFLPDGASQEECAMRILRFRPRERLKWAAHFARLLKSDPEGAQAAVSQLKGSAMMAIAKILGSQR